MLNVFGNNEVRRFYLSKDTFDGVPISIANHLKSEAKSLQSGFEMVRSIDEKCGLLDLLFLAEFAEKQHGELRGRGVKQSDVEEFVGVGIDSSVQPVSFVIDPNHRLV